MAGICEAGHRSTTDDYCDVCGLPVHPAPAGASPASAQARPEAAAPASQRCPNCHAVNPADALFCEACGYDYTTGTLPRSDVAGMLGLRPPEQEKPVTEPPASYQHATNPLDPEEPVDSLAAADAGDGAAQDGRPPGEAEQIDWPDAHEIANAPEQQVTPLTPPEGTQQPDAETPEAGQAPAPLAPPVAADDQAGTGPAASPTEDQGVAASGAGVTEPAAETVAPQAPGSPAADGTETPTEDAATAGRPAPRRESYVAEVWIDPDWYAVQQSPDPMPSVGLPTTVKLGDDNLVGRVSKSRGIFPEVDCGTDSGCSRSQARLTSDGTRWYVEDLQSSNGTYVAPASGPLPTTPITGRTELGPDDRVYVGAWTRIVVRKASKEEMDALG